MASADIKIQVPTAKVSVTYKFKNITAKKQTVTMAFPEEGYDAYLDKENKTYFKYFKSTVNGKSVSVKSLKRKEDEDAIDFGYKIWWVKDVTFQPNETLTVTNDYQSNAGGNTIGLSFIDYIVNSASTWYGKIGSLRIEANCDGLPNKTKFIANPAPHKVNKNTLLWFYKNIEPSTDNDVSILWEEKPGFHSNDTAFIDMFGRHPLIKN